MKKGMTPGAVEQMAGEIEQAGEEVRQIFQKATDRVTEIDWTGDDRDRFVTEFGDTIGQLVEGVVQNCTAFADRGRADAKEQVRVSS